MLGSEKGIKFTNEFSEVIKRLLNRSEKGEEKREIKKPDKLETLGEIEEYILYLIDKSIQVYVLLPLLVTNILSKSTMTI